MNRILWSIVIGIATTVSAVKADGLGPCAQAASDFGDQLAQRPVAKKLLSMQQSGDDPTAIQDYINMIQEAQKEGYTSLDDVATFVVIAGAQCEYQLGATPKHPPGFDNPTPAPIPASEQADLKALESSVPAASMAVKITSNRWTPDKALIATGTLTNTSAVPVTVTKVVATGFDGNQNLVAVAHGLPGDGSFTIANAEIAPGATVIFKVALSDEKKVIRFVTATPYIAQP
jgi:hypothetical protein